MTASPPADPDWRRFGRTTVLPLLLLVGLLVLLAQWHLDLAAGYTAPRVIVDDDGGFVFYDGGSRDSGFFFRRIEADELEFSKREWRAGSLATVSMTPDRVVALYGGPEPEDWFFSLYERETLERTWSGTLADRELGFERPVHLAALGPHVFVLGFDRDGALRVARVSGQGAVEALPATLLDAARPVGAEADAKSKPVSVPASRFVSAVHGGHLALFWRVAGPPEVGQVPKGEVRWTTFDGEAFGPVQVVPADLAAFTCQVVPGAEGAPDSLRLFGVPREGDDAKVAIYALEGDAFKPTGSVPYRREGLTGGAGVVALTAGAACGRELLFAQIGAAIRYCVREQGTWSEWRDLDRRPASQMAVVYGWFGSLMLLSGLLVAQGLRLFRRRRTGASRPQPPRPRPVPAVTGELASLFERGLAFGLDLVAVLLVATVVLAELAPELQERAAAEPLAQVEVMAWFVVLLLAYLVTFEVLFARTPGKLALGIEVQDVDGGRPARSALVFRNLLRVELLIPPAYLVPVFTFLMMVTSRNRQRPGDFVARTVVRRAAVETRPAASEAS